MIVILHDLNLKHEKHLQGIFGALKFAPKMSLQTFFVSDKN